MLTVLTKLVCAMRERLYLVLPATLTNLLRTFEGISKSTEPGDAYPYNIVTAPRGSNRIPSCATP